jgi:hypothetical protein
MPSFKLTTRGYSGGSWQGPGTDLYTYNSGWVNPENAFYSDGSGWVRFYGDTANFPHGNISLAGVGWDEEQGGEGGPPFNIHIWGSASFTMQTNGNTAYEGSGNTGSGPSLTTSTWIESGANNLLYDVRLVHNSGFYADTYIADPYTAMANNTWYNMSNTVYIANPTDAGAGGSTTVQIRHSASGIILSSFVLTINVS